MNENTRTFPTTAAARYDKALGRGLALSPVPDGCLTPQPTAVWPPENVALLERYRAWLIGLGVATSVIHHHRIPIAGHVLGLHLKPYAALDLDADLERAMTFLEAKQLSRSSLGNGRHSLVWFRRFLQQERGVVEIAVEPPYGHAERYRVGLPEWLLAQLEHLLHIRQANWRPSRRAESTYQFWRKYTQLWRWLYAHGEIRDLSDIKRRHLHAYIDEQLRAGYAVKSINQDLRAFQASLHFLRERDFAVPQALLRLPGLKEPDSLPRFLTDEQVCQVQADLEQRVSAARTPAQIRDALLDRAAFYLLWQGGLRLGEVEDLCLGDLSLSQSRLTVRRGKGLQDRVVYLTETAVSALQAYLTVRGPDQTDHVFLYRYKPLRKDLVRDRIKTAGKRAGVKATPHMLRHTFATQLLNVGCKITTIQALLGHRRLNTTLVYARVHDKTVAADYYAAMARIEQRLELPRPSPQPPTNSNGAAPGHTRDDARQMLALVTALQTEPLTANQQALVDELQCGLQALAASVNGTPKPKEWVVNEQVGLLPPVVGGPSS